MEYQCIVFDVAHTLLHKPDFWVKCESFLKANGCELGLAEVQLRHKVLSEGIVFPDRTSEDFYKDFNRYFLQSCGIIVTDNILNDFFLLSKNLPWEAFEDTKILTDLPGPLHIISNWNETLPSVIASFFPDTFTKVLGSEIVKDRKPNKSFYKILLKELNVPADKIVYIGDSYLLDYVPSMQLGFKSILLDRFGIHKDGAINKIGSLYELPKLLS